MYAWRRFGSGVTVGTCVSRYSFSRIIDISVLVTWTVYWREHYLYYLYVSNIFCMIFINHFKHKIFSSKFKKISTLFQELIWFWSTSIRKKKNLPNTDRKFAYRASLLTFLLFPLILNHLNMYFVFNLQWM